MNRWGDKNKYEYNLKKYYALVLTYVSKAMKNIIETTLAFHSTIQEILIELSRIIKVIMYDPYITMYAYVSWTEALYQILNPKQNEKENPINYTKIFTQESDLLNIMLV